MPIKFKIKRMILLILGLLILAMPLIGDLTKSGMTKDYGYYVVSAVLILAFVLFHKLAWKCPHCSKNPGYKSMDRCPHCNELLDP